MSYSKDAWTLSSRRAQEAFDALQSEIEWQRSEIERMGVLLKLVRAGRDTWREIALKTKDELELLRGPLLPEPKPAGYDEWLQAIDDANAQEDT